MERFRRTIEVVSALFFGLVAVITLAAATSRVTFSLGLPDAYEFACLAQGIAILWGISIATYDGKHVTVDLLYEKLSRRGRAWMDIVAALVTAIFLGLLAWMTMLRGIESLSSGLTTNELRIPIGPFWILGGAGLVAASLLGAVRVFNLVTEARK
jgi:TRAP-type C4-dicarboxylate transport system permease small subunit